MSEVVGGDETRVVHLIADRAASYLTEEIGLEVRRSEIYLENIKRLQLRHITSILSVEGGVRMLVAFSFDLGLAERVFEVSTEGLDIPESERELMLEDSVAEVINVAVGNAFTNLASGGVISISPPIVISEAKGITRHKGADFYSADLTTECGMLSIHFVGPKELFDEQLNYAENA